MKNANRMKPIVLRKGEKLSMDIAKMLFEDITVDEIRAEIKSYGPWDIPVSVKALCIHTNFDTGDVTIYGTRTMQQTKQSGYQLEGYVSIKGERVSAFTTSILFELENGHLINTCTIYPRLR